jgi:hypothetical protein
MKVGRSMKPFEIAVGVWMLMLFVMVGVVFASPLICSAPSAISTKLIEGIPAGIVALIVAGVASLIAFNQFRVAKAKLNLDLFEKRMEVFNAVVELLKACAMQAPVNDKVLREYMSKMASAKFLYGDSVYEYMHVVAKKNFEMVALIVVRSKVEGDIIRSAEHADVMECQSWFLDQFGEHQKLFEPFLSFSEWR